jgi:hypothetical protein
MKLTKGLTPRVLQHILSWGDTINKQDPKSWKKTDAQIYFLVYSEIREIRKKEYLKNKIKKYAKQKQKTN